MEGKEKNRLIPLSDYLLDVEKYILKDSFNPKIFAKGLDKIYNYNSFIRQNLAEPYEVNGVTAHPLNRFFPTDLEGNVLEDPNSSFNLISKTIELEVKQYTEAKNRVLFEGFENNIVIHDLCSSNKTIEDLIEIFKDIELTQTGAKMCGRG